MTITLDHDLLARLGLGELSTAAGTEALALMHERLQTRVGIRIVDRLSEAQMAEFEAAIDAGEAEASRWLDVHVADHVEVVRDEFQPLCAEVTDAAPAMLAELSRPPESGDPRAPAPSEPGPTLVGSEDEPCLVVSPSAGTVVGVNAGRDELWARSGDLPPVVLRLPVGHRVDVTMLWCGDGGEVRSRSEEVDHRWQVPWSGPGPPWSNPRSAACSSGRRWRGPMSGSPAAAFAEFTEGPWHVEDGQYIKVTNTVSERRLWLEQLHDGPHANAVRPHFTPDGRQLVAVFNARDAAAASGLSVLGRVSRCRRAAAAPRRRDRRTRLGAVGALGEAERRRRDR